MTLPGGPHVAHPGALDPLTGHYGRVNDPPASLL
jgi:hypothetical protein